MNNEIILSLLNKEIKDGDSITITKTNKTLDISIYKEKECTSVQIAAQAKGKPWNS
jgi:hypothetical protein